MLFFLISVTSKYVINLIIRTNIRTCNLVPRACDPREGNEDSGIIRFREDSDWPLKWMRSSILLLATIPGFRQRIIPEPSFPSQGSQARGTRLLGQRDWAHVNAILHVKNSVLPSAAKIHLTC
jgi:hypothetical protein